ncbi:MAG: autoinducer-2 kinase [Epsilonproteobacteria bacterium]|nr:autoinducer-2 kinase [Campylobacterota bacterium]
MKNYLLAIDAGTGSIRAVLFDTNGKQIAMAQREWIHLEEKGVKNSMSFDFATNWELTKTVIQEAIEGINPTQILALSATSMREGIVVYDKKGNPLWGVANVDARASKEVKELKKLSKNIETKFYKTSGQTFALGALPRLLWLKKNRPQIYKKVASISMIGDFILAKLSGKIAVDPSNAGTTGIFDLKRRTWDKKMAKEMGIKPEIFPPVLESGEILGNVTLQAAKETGLSTTTKVVMGGGDVQLGSAGLGVVNVGDGAILGGSFWQQVVNIPHTIRPPKDMSIRVNPHVVLNQSQAEGITFFSGLIIRWFRDAFCNDIVKKAKKKGIDPYILLEKKAKKIPVGSYEILPIFSDAMHYGKWYHASASLLNLSIDPTKTNRYSIYRALLENTAIVSALNLKQIEKTTDVHFKKIVFAGGASNSDLWCQIVADATGKTIKVPRVTEATALGAAMSAGIGVGIYKNFQDAAKKLVRFEKTYKPKKQNYKIYKQLTKKWQKAYKKQLQLVDENITTSMWSAPGI